MIPANEGLKTEVSDHSARGVPVVRKRSPHEQEASRARASLRKLMKEVDAPPPSGMSPRRHDARDDIPEQVREVVLKMLGRYSAQVDEARRVEERADRVAAPHISAAWERNFRTQRQLAELFELSDQKISKLRACKAGRLQEHRLEQALTRSATELKDARKAGELARARRWRWTLIGQRAGFTLDQMAQAAGVGRSTIEKDLKLASRSPMTAKKLLRALAASLEEHGAWVAAREEEALADVAVLEYTEEASRGDARVLHSLGWLWQQRGAREEAHRLYGRAADLGSPCSAHNLGHLLWETGELHDARVAFERAERKLDHRCANAAALGYFLSSQGKEIEARRAWGAAARRRGVAAGARAVALSFATEGRTAEADSWWEQAAELGDCFALSHVGHQQWIGGEHDKAEATFLKAARHGDAAAACWMGLRLLARDPTAAEPLLEQASEAGYAEASAALVSLFFDKRPARALTACERTRDQGMDLRSTYAILLEEADGSPEALATAQGIWEEQARDGDPVYTYMAGVLAARLGQRHHAEDLLWRALAHGNSALIDAAGAALAGLIRVQGQSEIDALGAIAEDAIGRGYHQVALPLSQVVADAGQTKRAIEMLRRARRSARGRTLKAELDARQAWIALPFEPGVDLGPLIDVAMGIWRRCAKRGSLLALGYMGAVYATEAGQEPAAERVFSQLVALGEPYRCELAECLVHREDFEQAAALLEDAIADGEDGCWCLRGRIAAQQGDPEQAMQWWLQGAKEDWRAAILAAQTLAAKGEEQETRKARRLLEDIGKAGSSCAWNVLGTLDLRAHRARALERFRTARDTGCYHGAYNLALALSEDPAAASRSRLEIYKALVMVLDADPTDLDAALLMAETTADDREPYVPEVVYEVAFGDKRAAAVLERVHGEQRGGRHPSLQGVRRSRRFRR